MLVPMTSQATFGSEIYCNESLILSRISPLSTENNRIQYYSEMEHYADQQNPPTLRHGQDKTATGLTHFHSTSHKRSASPSSGRGRRHTLGYAIAGARLAASREGPTLPEGTQRRPRREHRSRSKAVTTRWAFLGVVAMCLSLAKMTDNSPVTRNTALLWSP